MRFSVVLRHMGLILLLNALFMGCAGVYGVVVGDGGGEPLLYSAVTVGLVGLFPTVFVPSGGRLNAKEGYVIVVITWVAVCLFGMMPYVLWGGEFTFSSAWFESVSGYTTTGATILNDVEALPSSLLLWRSVTHWIGGMGVVVFALVLLPGTDKAQMMLSRTELSAIARQDFKYRSRIMLRVMVWTYVGLTLSVLVGLLVSGIPVFDAVNLSFSTVATGGFAVRNDSVGGYGNLVAEWVVMLGMLLSGVHFGLLYGLFSGKARALLRSPVVRFLLLVVLVCGVLVGVNVYASGGTGFWLSLHQGFFHVVSVMSTSGFSIAEISHWPPFALMVLLIIAHFGLCSGSTSGGLKLDRIMIVGSALRTHVQRRQSAHSVHVVHVGDIVVDERMVSYTLLFVVVGVGCVLLGSLFFTLAGYDLLVSLNIAVASLCNVGLTAGGVGTYESYAFLSSWCRVVSTLLMLLGRLEIFGLLLIFYPSSWK